jgi:hypothetical protein
MCSSGLSDLQKVHRVFDYSAKRRSDLALPVCGPEDGTSLAHAELSAIFARQTVDDDYSCGPDRPCRNGECPFYSIYLDGILKLSQEHAVQRPLFIATTAKSIAEQTVKAPMRFAGPTATPKQSAAKMQTLQERSVRSTSAVQR